MKLSLVSLAEWFAAGTHRAIKNPRTTSGGFYLPNLYLKVDCYSHLTGKKYYANVLVWPLFAGNKLSGLIIPVSQWQPYPDRCTKKLNSVHFAPLYPTGNMSYQEKPPVLPLLFCSQMSGRTFCGGLYTDPGLKKTVKNRITTEIVSLNS